MSLLAGLQLYLEAFCSIWNGRRPNMATLASLGIMLALMQAAADSLDWGKWILSHGLKLPRGDPDSLYECPRSTSGIRRDGGTSQLRAPDSSSDFMVLKRSYLTGNRHACILSCVHEGQLGAWIGSSFSVAAAACPCSLSLSVPTSDPRVSSVRASKLGVRLVTTYARLRSAASARTILFDKTGTLTQGDLKFTHASFSEEWGSSQKQDILWRAVQEVEAGNTHPIARALSEESHARLGEKHECLPDFVVSEIKHELGRGAQAVVTATHSGSNFTSWKLAIGSRAYIESLGVSINLSQIPVKTRNGITTTVGIAMDGKQAAVFVLEDKVRSDAYQVIRELKALGLAVGMITGDNTASATSVAREVGIDSDMVFANALPEEKSRILERFLQKGPAIYVGDNYNDILCFASASFSICVAGSDLRSVDDDCADATLISSETPPLSRIPLTILLARRMGGIVTQNYCWAVIYNILSVAWVLGLGGIGPPSP
ncbi:P-type ATPase [Fusarium napiforme]|uniref:P-type ATPase n=1 Tax=Fusarium napiforme TaxID=42672 RepID=A0A8H5IQ82_9HYPO|nr:P-type ATPase [Fusarium napiforme]